MHNRWVAAFLVSLFVIAGAMPVASASNHLGPVSAVESWVPWLILFTLVFFIVAWIGGKVAGVSQRSIGVLRTLATVTLVLLLIGGVSILTRPSTGCVDNPATPINECQVPPTHTFSIVATVGVTGGDTVPSGNFDSCDTEAGGTTGEWTTTEGTFDATANQFIARYAIDTDLAITAALWSEPNCLELDHDLHLNTPVDQNGDGVSDAISYFAAITSISRTTLSTDGSNGTLNTAGFVRDGVGETGDWYVLYRNDAGTFIPACPEFRNSGTLGSSCGAIAVGAHTGTAADDDVDLYIILEDRGLFGYQEPSVGSSVVITYTLAGHNFVLQILLNTRAATNLA